MVRATPYNFLVVTVMAVVGIAAARMIAARFGIDGLSALVG